MLEQLVLPLSLSAPISVSRNLKVTKSIAFSTELLLFIIKKKVRNTNSYQIKKYKTITKTAEALLKRRVEWFKLVAWFIMRKTEERNISKNTKKKKNRT